jgi:4-amino-4-deoxy-L-arabinose transferase-like glycosyltransferase
MSGNPERFAEAGADAVVPASTPTPARVRMPARVPDAARVPISASTVRSLALLLAFVVPVLAVGLANRGYWLSDEPFVAEVSREMLASGDWVTPRLNGEPFLEKPPLHYVCVALSYRALGVTPFAARVPSALASLVTILATFWLGRRLFDARTGFLGGVLLATTFSFFATAHYCLVDATLCAFVAIGFLVASYAFDPDRRPWAIPALYVAAAGAFLVKGPVGPILLGVGVSAVASFRGARRFFGSWSHVLGGALFLIIVAPWIIGLWRAGGSAFLREALVVNAVGRFLPLAGFVPSNDTLGQHVEPWYAYFGFVAGGFMPWTPLLVLAASSALSRLVRRGAESRRSTHVPAPRADAALAFLWSCSLAGFVLLSAASTKRNIYALPLYPILALVCAHALQTTSLGRVASVLARALLATQAAVATVLAIGVAGAVYVLSGPYFGEPPREGYPTLAVLLALLACCGSLVVWRAFAAGQRGRLLLALPAQLVACLVVFALVCAPLVESEKGFTTFFDNAVRIERERNRTPRLFTRHESYTGFAGLHFGVLERLTFRRRAPAALQFSRPVDVITDMPGLERLCALPRAQVSILTEQRTRGPGAPHALYLVELAFLRRESVAAATSRDRAE